MAHSGTTLFLAALTLAGAIASSAVTLGGVVSSDRGGVPLPSVSLPPGCVRPSDGFLIVMTEYGYNDSVLEGAGPSKAWPVITVEQGATVNITVCNADKTQAHGFQVADYFSTPIETVVPGEVLHVSFVASRVGTFQIYCAIFCTIHLFMEYGQLRVVGSQ